jgi:hypothetical protein
MSTVGQKERKTQQRVVKLFRETLGKVRKYWKATWSPEPCVVTRKVFSVRRYGSRKAKMLAIRARRAGLRSMQPAATGSETRHLDRAFKGEL